MKNKIEDLRNHLFETIERLKNPEEGDELTIDTAKAICQVSDRIVETAKVEIEYLKTASELSEGMEGTGFIKTKELT